MRSWVYLRPGAGARAAVWVIQDGKSRTSTGFAAGERQAAEEVLAAYIVAKHKPQKGARDPSRILIADILNLYLQERAPLHARPDETARRATALATFFGTMTLAQINGAQCRSYAQRRPLAAGRRELEDLRAAIAHYFADDILPPKVNIPLPEKAPARERWMTQEEAAKLIMTAWRRSQPMPKGGKRHVARHIARFTLVGLYTGTRAARICAAAIRPTPGRGYIDLETGLFYRRPPGERETNKRTPTIRLPDRLLAHIRRWARLGLCENCVVEWNGKPVVRVSKAFRRVATAAGLPDVTPHILRHTAITWAMQQGVAINDAEDFFGVSHRIMKANYAHHHPDHSRYVGEALSRRKRRA